MFWSGHDIYIAIHILLQIEVAWIHLTWYLSAKIRNLKLSRRRCYQHFSRSIV